MNDEDTLATIRPAASRRSRAWRIAGITALVVVAAVGVPYGVVLDQRNQAATDRLDAVVEKHKADMAALSKRLDRVGLPATYRHQALADARATQASRGTLQEYRAVIADEERISAAYVAEVERLYGELGHDPMVAAVLAHEDAELRHTTWPALQRVFRSRRGQADAIQALLDYVDAHRAAIRLGPEGHLVVETDEQQRSLVERLAAVDRANDGVAAALDALNVD